MIEPRADQKTSSMSCVVSLVGTEPICEAVQRPSERTNKAESSSNRPGWSFA